MSYDLYLRDRVTGECLDVPGHLMYGGNIKCEKVEGELVPSPITEAYLNITYNYSGYYRDAFPGLDADAEQHAIDAKMYGITDSRGGIMSLNGVTGAKAIPLLHEMIGRIEKKYKDFEGWICTQREKVWYEKVDNPEAKKDQTEMFKECLRLLRDGHSIDQVDKYLSERWKKQTRLVLVSEGDSDDYWLPTAANAIKPLYQLIALSELRPDGIWSEES